MTGYTIEDVQMALAVMALYLPDPDKELFAQVDDCKDPYHFNHLKRLLLEIRLACWRMMFPRRRVVNLQPGQRSRYDAPQKSDPFPVTLHINRESRQETLLHYYILDFPKIDSKGGGTRCHGFESGRLPSRICINPHVDSVHLSF